MADFIPIFSIPRIQMESRSLPQTDRIMRYADGYSFVRTFADTALLPLAVARGAVHRQARTAEPERRGIICQFGPFGDPDIIIVISHTADAFTISERKSADRRIFNHRKSRLKTTFCRNPVFGVKLYRFIR